MKTLRNNAGWLVIAVCVLWTEAIGAPIKFVWDAAPASEKVTVTHLRKKMPDGSTVFLAESNSQTVTAELPPGTYVLVATAQNSAGWSAFSDPVTVVIPEAPIVPPSPPKNLRIEIQTSNNLVDWTTDGFANYTIRTLPDGTYPPMQFFRTFTTLTTP